MRSLKAPSWVARKTKSNRERQGGRSRRGGTAAACRPRLPLCPRGKGKPIREDQQKLMFDCDPPHVRARSLRRLLIRSSESASRDAIDLKLLRDQSRWRSPTAVRGECHEGTRLAGSTVRILPNNRGGNNVTLVEATWSRPQHHKRKPAGAANTALTRSPHQRQRAVLAAQ